MASRPILLLGGLAAIAAGAYATWALTSPSQGGQPDRDGVSVTDREPEGDERSPELLRAEPPDRRHETNSVPTFTPAAAQLAVRKRFGPDMSSAKARADKLRELLSALEIEWNDVGMLLGAMELGEPLGAEVQRLLIEHLRMGTRPLQIRDALKNLGDPAMVEPLFELVDDQVLELHVRNLALRVLSKMRGGDADTIATQLESRLSGDVRADHYVLGALAARGGPEAARAIIQYVETSENPKAIHPGLFRDMKRIDDPALVAMVGEALGRATNPDHLDRLLGIFVQSRATALGDNVRALAKRTSDAAMQTSLYRAMARMGDADSIAFLVEQATAQGDAADRAMAAFAALDRDAVDARGREQIRNLLDRSDDTPNPTLTKSKALFALGKMRSKDSLEAIWSHVDDPSPRVANTAIEAVGRIGEPARKHVPALTERLSSARGETRRQVLQALGRIGGDEALQTLRQWHGRDDLSPAEKSTVLIGIKIITDAQKRQYSGR